MNSNLLESSTNLVVVRKIGQGAINRLYVFFREKNLKVAELRLDLLSKYEQSQFVVDPSYDVILADVDFLTPEKAAFINKLELSGVRIIVASLTPLNSPTNLFPTGFVVGDINILTEA